ncbi:MAG: dihydropteroate synthase [Pseudomonadota bacterium]|nr:dihydropteroate synthase [Pseudomonadota bacterium]
MIEFTGPKVMGIVNVTPDSFSDGGSFFAPQAALTHSQHLIESGADIIDIGGESTRPQAQPISVDQELDRVIPVVEAIKARWPIVIAVDTYKAEVMQAAIAAGAHIINDIYALQQPGSLEVLVAHPQITVCLMHMQGQPQTMQHNPCYQNVVEEIKSFLYTRIQACVQAGIAAERIWIDPGFGFGKTLNHNLQLMNRLQLLTQLGYPLLVGVSRKAFIGNVLKQPQPQQRLYGGLALAVLAVTQGAQVIRTHDVAATVEALHMIQAVLTAPEC